MNSVTKIKFCGLTSYDEVAFAKKNNIYWIGFIFAKGSSRFIEIGKAKEIISKFDNCLNIVGVFVDANDDWIKLALEAGINYIQLHGEESPERCEEIKSLFKTPIIKAIPIEKEEDLKNIEFYNDVCDYFLLDKKNVNNEGFNGGTGENFDWNIISKNKEWLNKYKPWILSGGLNIHNVQEAIRLTGTKAIDVSSGIEYNPGSKSIELMELFIKEVNKKV
ncbi:MAG: hypothetical protein CMJ12_01925 [Pelagibacterales bacterium]|nr:hypothetical protein [Pelagibacterales bacterium]PPR16699.1 MAG: N-(5'-phosphoribosyl)anthranilate isomerase [Alphaproteobacteria bacterium MarineAlpha9_Bin3]|tara:strand:- start:1657 stop:2316 length:660 start_codon:yes stop_codon:yes gene_type:complete